MNGLRFDSLFGIGVCPFDWGCRFIVLADVAHELGAQIGDRVKDAACDDMALNFGEPVFNLVQPRGISRRVVDSDIGVGLKEGIHQPCLMSREVIGNDMDRLASGLRGDDLFKEAHKLGTGVAFGRSAENFSALRLQSGIERKRPVAKVFKPMRLGSARRKWQDGIKPIQSLNGALFIDTKDHGMGRRVQVEADDVRRLCFKVWVIADHAMTQAMRLQPVATQTLATAMWLVPSFLAKRLLLHCVVPSSGPRRVHSRIRASHLGASLAAVRP
jgi:hypothetical protein